MKALELLLERATSQIFHYTNIRAALNIVTTGKFELSSTLGSIEEKYAPKGYPYFLSCTRTLTGGYHKSVSDSAVMFNLDGNWYNQRYKAGPVDYWGDRHNEYGRVAEAEDRIFGRTETMPITGVTAIHIYVEPMDKQKRKNWAEHVPAVARRLLIQAKLKGIKTYFYEDKVAWSKQDTRKCVTIHKGQETVTGPAKERMFTRQTSWMEPWLELIYKDRTTGLSKKAETLAYSLAYDSEYYTDSMVKGFANDLSNARKPNAGPDREVAVKVIAYMQRNNMTTVAEFIAGLKKKWAAIKTKEKPPVTESYEGKDHRYLKLVPALQWSNVNRSTWETIQDEGLDEEFDIYDRTQWQMAALPISRNDSANLMVFDNATVEDFNIFDIGLKGTYNNIIDFIDYDKGTVTLVKCNKSSLAESVYYLGHPNTEYFEGDCALFAVALNNLTGYLIYGLVENGNLIHAYVKSPNGTIIDASGTDTNIASMLAEFPNEGNAEEMQLTAKQAITLAYGNGYVPNLTSATQAAKDLLEEEGLL
jgi:hypothetical protein